MNNIDRKASNSDIFGDLSTQAFMLQLARDFQNSFTGIGSMIEIEG